MKSTFKVLFYLKKGSEKKNGEVMIMARITIDGKLCQFSTNDVKQLVGISKTIATYRKYEVTRRHLAEFIQSKYNISDIAINEITPMFITDFELYLRTTCKCSYNTTAKFMQFFKRIILIARNNGILIGDPFANYKIRLEKVDRGYLTEDEIKIILKKKMVSERLENVRDLFIFSCFTFVALTNVCLIINKLQTNNKGIGNGLETTYLHHFA